MDNHLKELVEKAMQGDRKAFEQIIEIKHRNILYMTSHFSVNPQDIDDHAQEAVINVMKGLPKLREPEKFESWLIAVVKNTCMDRNRRQGIHNSRYTPTDLEKDEDVRLFEEDHRDFLPPEYVEDKEKRGMVMAEIIALPEHFRETLLMFYYQDMSYSEIAEVRGINRKKVANDLLRGRMKLKERLEQMMGREFLFSLTPVSTVPVLARLFKADAKAKITPRMSRELIAFTHKVMAEPPVTGSSIKTGMRTKIVLGTTAAAVIMGVIVANRNPNSGSIAAETYPPQAVTEAYPTEAATAPSMPEPPAETAAAPSEPEPPAETEKSINVLADMIGADHEELLLSFEEGGVDEAAWQVFINDIGAEFKGQSTVQNTEEYMLYTLYKQDRQLLLMVRRNLNSQELAVKHRFGMIEPLPDMIDLVVAFEGEYLIEQDCKDDSR